MPPKKFAEKKKEQNVKHDNHWSEEEKVFLMESVRAHLTDGHHVNCNVAIERFNWNLVRVTNRSPDECRKQMELMLKTVCRYRTWMDVLNAYEQEEIKGRSNKRTATTSRKRRTNYVVPEKEEGHDIEIQPVRRRKKADVTRGSVTNKSSATSSRKRRDKNVVPKKKEESHEIGSEFSRRRKKADVTCGTSAIPSGSGTIDVLNREFEDEVVEKTPEIPACELTTNHEREPRKTQPFDVMSVNLAIPSGSGTNKRTATKKRPTKNVERESHEIGSEPSRRRMKADITFGESAIPSGSGRTIDEHDVEVEDEVVEQSSEIPTCDLTTNQQREPRKTQQLRGHYRTETHGPYTIDVKNVVEFNGIREKLPLIKNEESANTLQFQFTTTIQMKTEETLSEEPDRNKLKRKQPNKCRTNGAKKKPSLIASDSDE